MGTFKISKVIQVFILPIAYILFLLGSIGVNYVFGLNFLHNAPIWKLVLIGVFLSGSFIGIFFLEYTDNIIAYFKPHGEIVWKFITSTYVLFSVALFILSVLVGSVLLESVINNSPAIIAGLNFDTINSMQMQGMIAIYVIIFAYVVFMNFYYGAYNEVPKYKVIIVDKNWLLPGELWYKNPFCEYDYQSIDLRINNIGVCVKDVLFNDIPISRLSFQLPIKLSLVKETVEQGLIKFSVREFWNVIQTRINDFSRSLIDDENPVLFTYYFKDFSTEYNGIQVDVTKGPVNMVANLTLKNGSLFRLK